VVLDGLTLLQYQADGVINPAEIVIEGAGDQPIHALSLVDTRTDDFVQLAPAGWQRVFSGDVKIYENLDVLPRAFVVHRAVVFNEDGDETEAALETMTDADFDPRETVTLHSDELVNGVVEGVGNSNATITDYDATRVEIAINADNPGWLVLTDAFYPGWQAVDQNGDVLPVYRADVMFRAVPIDASTETVTFSYEASISVLGWMGGLWAVGILILMVVSGSAIRRSPEV